MTRTFRARRFVALAGALSLGAGLLAACSSGSAGDDTSSPADTSTSASDTPAVKPADTLTLTSGYAAGDATGNFLDDAVKAFTEKTGELSAVKDAVADSTAPAVLKSVAADIVGASAMTPWLDNAYDPQIVSTYLSQTQMLLGGQRTPEGVMDDVRATAKRVRDAS